MSNGIEQILEDIKSGKIRYIKNSELDENELRLYRFETRYAHKEIIGLVLAENVRDALTLLKEGAVDWDSHKVEKIEEYSLRDPKFIDDIEKA